MRNLSPPDQRSKHQFPHEVMLDCIHAIKRSQPIWQFWWHRALVLFLLPSWRCSSSILCRWRSLPQRVLDQRDALGHTREPQVSYYNKTLIFLPWQALFIDFLQSYKNHLECLEYKATRKFTTFTREHFALQIFKATSIDFGVFPLGFT